MTTLAAEYEIPNYEEAIGRSYKRWFAVGWPTLIAISIVISAFMTKDLIGGLILGAIFGFFLVIPLFFASLIFIGRKYNGKLKARFTDHSYDWYQRTFPDHVLSGGRIRCRHCGGGHITAKNLMKNTYTRAHVCNQCGKTLYFSPEQ